MFRTPTLMSLVGYCLAIVLMDSFASTAEGTVYYVDYGIGSNSNSGISPSAPWKHVPGDSGATGNASSTTPAAGDTICIKGGATYSSGNRITLKSSGTSGSRIVYDGNCAGFGNGNKAILNNNTNVYVASKDYNTIKNFEFTGFTIEVITQNYLQYPDDAIGVTVDSNYIHHGSIPSEGAVAVWNAQNFTLSNNVFKNVNYDPGYGGGRGPTYFQCRFSGSTCVGDSTGLTIIGNTFSYNGNTPVFCFGQSNLTITKNTILGPNRDPHSQGITHYNAAGGSATITRNYFDGERVFLAMESHGGATVTVANNIAYCRNVTWNITIWGGTNGTLYVVNNTFLSAGTNNDSVFIELTPGYSTRVFKNNIATGGINNGGTQTHNTFTTKTSPDPNTIYQPNLALIFRDTAFDSVDDYRILSSFAGRDAGTAVSEYGVTVDYDGLPRPSGSGWDMGAYEAQLTSLSPPPAPGGLRVE